MRDLVDLLHRLRTLPENARAVLVTLVDAEGSSYRKPGARMLVEADGTLTGLLSGGCLEQDLHRIARETATAGRARSVVYDLAADDEILWGFGTGCAGRLTLLLEPLDHTLRIETIAWLTTLLYHREEHRRATLFALDRPADDADDAEVATDPIVRLEHQPNPPFYGSFSSLSLSFDLSLNRTLLEELRNLRAGSARTVGVEAGGRRVRCLLESILPPPHLLVVGAGRDAPPLLRLARELGWAATVVEPRPTEAAAARVDGLARYASVAPAALAREVELSPRTAAVLATHRYLDDLAYLGELLPAHLGYLAVLGPAARRERLLADLARQGRLASGADAARVRGPAGLDLGGRSPEEVALSIVAEIQSVFAGEREGEAGSSVRPLSARAPERRERQPQEHGR